MLSPLAESQRASTKLQAPKNLLARPLHVVTRRAYYKELDLTF